MKRVILIGLFLAITFCFGNKPIDFHHKLMEKEIKKTLEVEDFHLQEINQHDSLTLHESAGKFFIISDYIKYKGYCYIGRVNSCRAGGCSVSGKNQIDHTFEYFDYIIIFDSTFTILSVRVFNYQATHGHEICSKSWLKQFRGYKGDIQLKVGKDIDSISGATVSVHAITTDIEIKAIILKELIKGSNKSN